MFHRLRVWSFRLITVRKDFLLPFACALMAITLSGCSGRTDLAPLEGKVRYKANLLKTGTVMLQPAQGGEFSRADIQPDGTFALQTVNGEKGATIGLNRVRVTCFPNKREAVDASGEGDFSLGKSFIPERYNNFSSSELTIEVLPAENPPYLIELTD